jgi:hypothetical protein
LKWTDAYSFWFLHNKDMALGIIQAIVAQSPQKIPVSKQNQISVLLVVELVARVNRVDNHASMFKFLK